MGKITKLWKNRAQIMEGIKNSIIRDEFVEAVSEERYSICNTCPDKDTTGSTCVVRGSKPCCKLCGCSLAFKTRSLSSDCPADKWVALISEDDSDKLDTL